MSTPQKLGEWASRTPETGSFVSGSLGLLSPGIVLGAAIESRRDVRLVLRKPDSGGVVAVVLRAGRPVMVFSPGDGRSLAELLVASGRIDRAAVRRLADERPRAALSLQTLVREHTALQPEEVQALLDYQARQRLLDALVWRQGFFHLEDHAGAEATGFSLALPSLTTLVARAEERARRLPSLLGLLPSSQDNTTVRRKRMPRTLANRLEQRVLTATAERLPLPDLLVRLLVDDDIGLEAVLSLSERGELALEPRARLVADAEHESCDLSIAELVREILAIVRGRRTAESDSALWLVVSGPRYELAAEVVSALGAERSAEASGAAGAAGVCRALLRPAPGVTISWLAAQPEALNSGALFGVMGRCDGVIVVRDRSDGDAIESVDVVLRRLLAALPRLDARPPVLGLDVGRGWHAWSEAVDASLLVPELSPAPGGGLSASLLEGMLAAARSAVVVRGDRS